MPNQDFASVNVACAQGRDGINEEDKTVTAHPCEGPLGMPPLPLPLEPVGETFPGSPTLSVFSIPTSGCDSVNTYSSLAHLPLRGGNVSAHICYTRAHLHRKGIGAYIESHLHLTTTSSSCLTDNGILLPYPPHLNRPHQTKNSSIFLLPKPPTLLDLPSCHVLGLSRWGVVLRSNSLGDLKITAKISQAKVGLKRDLGMVREFAAEVESEFRNHPLIIAGGLKLLSLQVSKSSKASISPSLRSPRVWLTSLTPPLTPSDLSDILQSTSSLFPSAAPAPQSNASLSLAAQQSMQYGDSISGRRSRERAVTSAGDEAAPPFPNDFLWFLGDFPASGVESVILREIKECPCPRRAAICIPTMPPLPASPMTDASPMSPRIAPILIAPNTSKPLPLQMETTTSGKSFMYTHP